MKEDVLLIDYRCLSFIMYFICFTHIKYKNHLWTQTHQQVILIYLTWWLIFQSVLTVLKNLCRRRHQHSHRMTCVLIFYSRTESIMRQTKSLFETWPSPTPTPCVDKNFYRLHDESFAHSFSWKPSWITVSKKSPANFLWALAAPSLAVPATPT